MWPLLEKDKKPCYLTSAGMELSQLHGRQTTISLEGELLGKSEEAQGTRESVLRTEVGQREGNTMLF